MFQTWRVQLRQAEQAMAGGRLEEAGRLLAQNDLRQFMPGIELSTQVAERMARRGRERMEQGDTLAGWRDFDAASSLATDTPDVVALRQQLVARATQECQAFLAAGDPAAALKRLAGLESRGLANSELRALEQVAGHWDGALKHGRQGNFAAAELELATATALRPGLKPLEERRQAYRAALAEHRKLMDNLYEAVERRSWTQVLALADKLLELAPECQPAREARRQAWSELSPALRQAAQPAAAPSGSTHSPGRRPEEDTVTGPENGTRFLLWVDAVGGYLVCRGSEIVIGQPVPGNKVDIPILADLSRRHATIRRDGEGYLIQPARDVKVDGREVHAASLLADGNLIELGRGVVLQFRKPHALSNTARLEFVSRHRTQPPVDAVLLMAETLVLGPKPHSHVVCRHWDDDIVIFRQGEELHCRAEKGLEVDGQPPQNRARLGPQSRASSDEFTFSLEPL